MRKDVVHFCCSPCYALDQKITHRATHAAGVVIQSDKRSVSPFTWNGSCFQLLLTDAKLYGLLLLLFLGLILRYTGAVKPVPFAETLQGTMAYVSFALTLVLTFYLNTSYERFIQQGQLARSLVKNIILFCFISPDVALHI